MRLQLKILLPPRDLDPERHTFVFVSPSAFRRVWFALMLAHSLCAAFVASVGSVYVYVFHSEVVYPLTLYGVVVAANTPLTSQVCT